MPEQEYHQVLCCLTEDQYRQIRKEFDTGPSGPLHPPLLFRTAEGNGDPIFEDQITIIVRDALMAIAQDDDTRDRLAGIQAHDLDALALPFPQKLDVMRAAAEHWEPPRQERHNHFDSYWRGDTEQARQLLERHPDLRYAVHALILR